MESIDIIFYRKIEFNDNGDDKFFLVWLYLLRFVRPIEKQVIKYIEVKLSMFINL